ncbi:hypothetical protein UFOVP1020_38 [uncultured Caudovirales phage]|uniref:Uncharacterized protein n=1 Tax=uncultured Caudovirales phage TaxID=2100421 RepID=A0A6J5SXJ3_9CAUD|nr:hypothetical protein UFOVP512_43 [uncultured Caudovirales phage]CAB4178697.1 hypothetical protein UFOVP1020_38 [uncultured Caudovirales phage]CAB4188027.1 hypothetical protein UFOVP1170_33 [uncultured Caudovirales phage]CAB4220302.1 hypothetical protein UFOVP1621_12 [uncultured Caudovirales phage]
MASKSARTLISEAMQDLGVVADQESMTDTQGNYGFRKLNDLLAGFESEGIRYAHTDLASLDTTVNVPDGQLRNVGLMLQREIAGAYGVPLSDDDRDAIHKAKMALQAFYYVPITTAPEMALRRRQYGRFNFSNG